MRSLDHRVLVTCIALRTNLTMLELAAVTQIPDPRSIAPSQPSRRSSPHVCRHDHPINASPGSSNGTLIPTRDHRVAGKSKNYRWSCNAQILIRRRDLAVIAAFAGGPGNRNDPIHYRGSGIELLCKAHRRVLADGGYRGVPELRTPRFHKRRIVRDQTWLRHRRRRARVEHAIARLKDWRVLRDHRRRGHHLDDTLRAVCVLHNLRLEMRDNS